MPKIKNVKQFKHPLSRKVKAVTKQTLRQEKRNKKKLSNNIKQKVISDKVLWFRDHLLDGCTVYTAEQTGELIAKYLTRFNEELEQIEIKHTAGNRKNRQHGNREDIIKLTLKRETEEYITCGIEIPDVMNEANLITLRGWDGELRLLQHVKLKRITKKYLEGKTNITQDNSANNNQDNNCKMVTN